MSDVSVAAPPDLAAPLGWIITDPDGNVVDSGQIIELDAVTDAGTELADGCDC